MQDNKIQISEKISDFIVNTTKRNYINLGKKITDKERNLLHRFLVNYGIWGRNDDVRQTTRPINFVPKNNTLHDISFILNFYEEKIQHVNKNEEQRLQKECKLQGEQKSQELKLQECKLQDDITSFKNQDTKTHIHITTLANPNINHTTPINQSQMDMKQQMIAKKKMDDMFNAKRNGENKDFESTIETINQSSLKSLINKKENEMKRDEKKENEMERDRKKGKEKKRDEKKGNEKEREEKKRNEKGREEKKGNEKKKEEKKGNEKGRDEKKGNEKKRDEKKRNEKGREEKTLKQELNKNFEKISKKYRKISSESDESIESSCEDNSYSNEDCTEYGTDEESVSNVNEDELVGISDENSDIDEESDSEIVESEYMNDSNDISFSESITISESEKIPPKKIIIKNQTIKPSKKETKKEVIKKQIIKLPKQISNNKSTKKSTKNK